jgi:arylsulfatase A-like enzyme
VIGGVAVRSGRIAACACLGALVAICAGSCRCGSTLEKGKAFDRKVGHVIIISIDTLRADALSLYDEQGAPVPHIERLASHSVVFTNARAASPWTLATMASVLTGLPTDVHQAFRRNSKLPEFVPTLAEHMKEAGYYTTAAGINGYLGPKAGLTRGFDEYHFDVQDWFEHGGRQLPEMAWLEPGRRKEVMYTGTPCLTRFAFEWLDANHDRDFFLWLHFLDPHGPYWPPPRLRPEGPVPKAVKGALHSRKATYSIKTPHEKRMHQAFYRGEVRWVDEAVGRIVERLESLGIYDESLIVLTSDHGEEFWEHGGFDHGHTVYEELLRVPLIVKLPRSAGHGRGAWSRFWGGSGHRHVERDELVTNQGIMPLILDACGITSYNPYLSSMSLSPLVGLGSGEEAPPAFIYSGGLLYGKNRECVLFGSMKYIVCPETGKHELYDLVEDPAEKESLVKTRPAELARGKELLEKHRKASEVVRSHYKVAQGEQIELDEETLEKLRAMGYVL